VDDDGPAGDQDADPGSHHAQGRGQEATDGISLFYVDFDREKIHATPIPKMGRKAIESNAVFIDDLHVPADALVGEEGAASTTAGGLNPERV
jgi:acyl-CoA dehydrogenase